MLNRLLAFLTLAVAPETPDPAANAAPSGAEQADPADPADPGAEDDWDALLGDAGEPSGGPAEDPKDKTLRELRERADRAERELANDRSARAMQQPPQPQTDPDYEREEQQIRQAREQGADEQNLGWLRWQIDIQRRTRASERTAAQARLNSDDAADRAAFDAIQHKNPKLYARYAEKIEAAAREWRQRTGQVISRAGIMRLMIGDDVFNGSLKPKRPASAPASGGVPRGKMPGVRTDVRPGSKGASDERQKRRERLENQIL